MLDTMKSQNGNSAKPRRPGRPKIKNKKTKESITVDPATWAAVTKEAKRLGVSKSHFVERCLKCQILKDCKTPCD